MAHVLADLPYDFSALEPYIDAKTMQIHHDLHHGTYIKKLNEALAGTGLEEMPLEELLGYLKKTNGKLLKNDEMQGNKELSTEAYAAIRRGGSDEVDEAFRIFQQLSEEKRTAVRNHGGGHYNHDLFWHSMSKDGGGMPTGDLKTAIENTWTAFENFKQQFSDAAATLFGSGWAWLSMDASGALKIHKTPNQDTPLAENLTPLLGLDVWEHAYYLHYKNRRPEYIEAFFNIINWPEIEKRYKAGL